MVRGGGLSAVLLVGRGTAKPLLPGGHPAQAAETAQEFPGTYQERRGHSLSRGSAQSIGDGDAEPLIGYRSDSNAWPLGLIGLVEEIKQSCRGLDEIARGTE